MDYKPDGTLFATAGSDCCVRVYDEATRKIKVEFSGGGNTGGEAGHTNRVFAVKFDKEDENMLISGGWDNNVKVWDLREPNPVRNINGPYICGDALDLHEGYILTGSWRSDKQLQLWDFGTCEFIEDIPMNDGLASPQPCQIYAA